MSHSRESIAGHHKRHDPGLVRGKPKSNGHTKPGRGASAAANGTFLRLSRILTGKETLDVGLAVAYLERAREKLAGKLDALLEHFDRLLAAGANPIDAVKDILIHPVDGPSAKLILLLWYTGAILNADGDWEIHSADQYYRALIWEAIGAHPPTLSNGYYGHWKYPAEYEA